MSFSNPSFSCKFLYQILLYHVRLRLDLSLFDPLLRQYRLFVEPFDCFFLVFLAPLAKGNIQLRFFHQTVQMLSIFYCYFYFCNKTFHLKWHIKHNKLCVKIAKRNLIWRNQNGNGMIPIEIFLMSILQFYYPVFMTSLISNALTKQILQSAGMMMPNNFMVHCFK